MALLHQPDEGASHADYVIIGMGTHHKHAFGEHCMRAGRHETLSDERGGRERVHEERRISQLIPLFRQGCSFSAGWLVQQSMGGMACALLV